MRPPLCLTFNRCVSNISSSCPRQETRSEPFAFLQARSFHSSWVCRPARWWKQQWSDATVSWGHRAERIGARASVARPRGNASDVFRTSRIGRGKACARLAATMPYQRRRPFSPGADGTKLTSQRSDLTGLSLRPAHEALRPAPITFRSREIARSSSDACASFGRGLCYVVVRQ